MADLDQTARFALQDEPAESIRWVLPKLDEDLAFQRWLDTRAVAFPGEPKRRCDTVAELVSRSGRQPPWALVLEVEARPRATMAVRVLEYEARLLRKLRHGPRRRDAYQVAAVVLYLTGRKRTLELRMLLPGTGLGLRLRVKALCLARQRAAATLARIARGELGLSILPWLPLMLGGGEPEVVQEWLRLARTRPSGERRANYAGLALVFAEWAGCLKVWQEALEGWEMWQSQVVAGWKNEGRQAGLQEGRQAGLQEGRLEEKRSDLLKVLRARFPGAVPAELEQAIQATADLDVLARWFDAALVEPSLEAFQALARGTPPPAQPNGAPGPG
jgi:hypothetical protein